METTLRYYVSLNKFSQVYRYHEKNLQQKLEILYQRNFYIYAINLAQKVGVDTLQQNVIFRKYGDYLYQKGDYDTAMQQYLRAIDNTEPSQVIRKVSSLLIPKSMWLSNNDKSSSILSGYITLSNIWKNYTNMKEPQRIIPPCY